MSFRPSPSARARLHALKPGQHLCLFYDATDEQIGISVEYIRGGLERGQRVLYVADRATLDRLRETLNGAWVRVDEEISRGALVLLDDSEVYLQTGRFDIDRMMTLLTEAVDQAAVDGFEGLRAAGDMTWLAEDAPGTSDAAGYESRMNDFYAEHRALGLCLYNRQRLGNHLLDAALRTHPTVLIGNHCCGDNPYYEAPEVFLRRQEPQEPFGTRMEHIQALATTPSE